MVSPSFLTQVAESSVPRTTGAELLLWARSTMVPEGDGIGLTGAASPKTRPGRVIPRETSFLPFPQWRPFRESRYSPTPRDSQHHGATDL